MRRSFVAGVVTAAALMVSACTAPEPEPTPAGDTREPSVSSSAPASDGPAVPDEDAVTLEATYGDVPVSMTVHPVRRSADVALVSVDWTVPDDSPRSEPLPLGILLRAGVGAPSVGSARLVDLAESWVSWPELADGSLTASKVYNVQRGETVSSELLFAAPPGPTVSLLLPLFGYVTDIPVIDAEPDEVRPDDFEVAPGEIPLTAGLESFTSAFDEGASSSAEGEETTVALASDVLFPTDEFELTPEARSRVEEVARKIKEAAQDGEVDVVGHTDDVGSDAYNRDLSMKRAESVAARLAPTLGPDYTVTTDGRGESEPAVEGTSSEARAANRRVEIHFDARVPGAPVDLSSVPLPDAEGAVGSGHETVEVVSGAETYDVSVRRVEARSGHLIGTIEVVRRSEGGSARIPFLAVGRDPQFTRGFGAVTQVAGATAVRLAGPGSWVYPVDHEVGTDDRGFVHRTVLADRTVADPFDEAGMPAVATVTWPDTGQETVTVDVAGRFRITDVPVEGR